jgi:Xaa-Pro aminopeptidase
MSPDAALKARRERVASALALETEVLLIAAGEPIPIPGGADQCFPFLAHAEYVYLTDREIPGAVLAFDPGEGWTHFVPEVTERDRIWEGRSEPEPGTEPLPGLAAWLGKRRGRPTVGLGSPLPGFRVDEARLAEVRARLSHARRPKDDAEIERIRSAVTATAAGYRRAAEIVRPGVSERGLAVELEAEFFRGGADRTCYQTIVGAGPNAAVFHFSPGGRRLRPGELVLIDAGAEIRRYGCDVTRVYPADGAWAGPAGDLRAIVERALDRAVERCGPGVEMADVHRGACADLTEGLLHMGLLRGSPDSLIERGAHALFFPHGIGHLVGLGVRDASGRLPGRAPRSLPGLRQFGTDLPLEPGYVTTIEPGLYFIPALLRDPKRRESFGDAVDWERAESFLPLGGVRLEENVLVTATGGENLTRTIPR